MELSLNDLMSAYQGLNNPSDYYAASLRQLIGEREDLLRSEIARLAVEASSRNGWSAEHRDRLLHFAEHGAAADLESTWRHLRGVVH